MERRARSYRRGEQPSRRSRVVMPSPPSSSSLSLSSEDILPSDRRSTPLHARRRSTTRAPLHVIADLDRDFVPIVPRNPNHQRCLVERCNLRTKFEEKETRNKGGEGEKKDKGERHRDGERALCAYISATGGSNVVRNGTSWTRWSTIRRLVNVRLPQRAHKMAPVARCCRRLLSA